MKRVLYSLLLLLFAASFNAQEYPKVILSGDYPDPTIVRDGEDYYMTHSPFYYTPGFLIWHSRDLMNWTPLCRALPEHSGSAMAPDLIKYAGRFYLYYPAAGTNWVSYADDIRGPWSKPVDLKVGGIDPGHVVGKDGKRYLYLNDGWMIGLTADGLATTGERKKVYDGWEFPTHWDTEGMWLESPKLIYKDGYYYMTSAQGGTAGPPTSHMVVAARSESPVGPWENSPYNPIVHTYDVSDNWWSKGHGTLIDDVNGNWWIVYHAYANGYHTLGRQTLIEPIEWASDGWYRAKKTAVSINPVMSANPEASTNPATSADPATSANSVTSANSEASAHPAMSANLETTAHPVMSANPEASTDPATSANSKGAIMPDKTKKYGLILSDDFAESTLGLQWTFWGENAMHALFFKNNTMEVEGKGIIPADGRLLLVTPTDKNYETQVEVIAGKNNTAGLLLYYNEKAFTGVVSDGRNFTVYKNAEEKLTFPNRIGKRFFVKIHNQGHNVTLSVGKDGENWTPLIEKVDVSGMHHNNYGGFYALRPALVSIGKGRAGFRQFRYRNAVPQEKEMSAYLMVFHRDDTHGLYMAISPDGYHFTALNDARPVIAGDTIANQKGIRDPHIYRGPDGAFYLVMTDLHIFAQRDGLRDTEWERDGKEYGWGNNRGLVLMKSWNLIDWKRTNIRFDELSAAYSEIGCAWAPETIYDEEKGKLMIYYTMRFKNEANRLYYVYVNEDFDRLESKPQLLFEYPDKNITAIDGDITKVGDKYRMFYVSHDGQAGIKQAVSDKINSDYVFDPRWYDPEPKACEAPNVWKRIGQERWVLMYDCYGQKVHNFGFVETTDFVNFTNLGHFNEGVMKSVNFTSPKHGAVIPITEAEAAKLTKHWSNKSKIP